MSIKFNTELLADIQDLVNRHKDDIEIVTTQYHDDKKGLFVITLQFYPVIVSTKEQEI